MYSLSVFDNFDIDVERDCETSYFILIFVQNINTEVKITERKYFLQSTYNNSELNTMIEPKYI